MPGEKKQKKTQPHDITRYLRPAKPKKLLCITCWDYNNPRRRP